MIATLSEKADYDATHSEDILLTPTCIDYMFTLILGNNVKSAVNAALVESEDVEAVLGVELY